MSVWSNVIVKKSSSSKEDNTVSDVVFRGPAGNEIQIVINGEMIWVTIGDLKEALKRLGV